MATRIPDTHVTLTDAADGPPLALVQAAEDVKWLVWTALVVAVDFYRDGDVFPLVEELQ